MINSQTAKLLRRWIVAGLAAALALAWTITTLVAPSQASTDQTYNISDTFQGTSSQQPVSLNMGDGWNDTGAVINFSYRQNTGQWTNYQRYAAENGRTQQFQEALDRNFEDNMEALGTAGRYFHIQSYPAAAHGAIIGGVFCADPEVTTVDYYHLGSSKDLRDKANKLEMTLDPAQAIANTGSRAYRTGFNMTDDQKKQMQILAYLYQGGDPRLEYVKADKSVADAGYSNAIAITVYQFTFNDVVLSALKVFELHLVNQGYGIAVFHAGSINQLRILTGTL